jgi:hypothetical protein
MAAHVGHATSSDDEMTVNEDEGRDVETARKIMIHEAKNRKQIEK